MASCIFCQIAGGQLPARRVYEDESAIAFLDLNPITPGHCLVIPRKHIVWYTDMQPADAGPFSKALFLVARKIKKATNAERVSILIRGTRVPHLHALLIPKLPGQDNIFDKTLDLHHFIQERQAQSLSDRQLDEIAEKIRNTTPV